MSHVMFLAKVIPCDQLAGQHGGGPRSNFRDDQF